MDDSLVMKVHYQITVKNYQQRTITLIPAKLKNSGDVRLTSPKSKKV
jgi:hypothetical protein